MKLFGGLVLLLFASVIADDTDGDDAVPELPLAENCDADACVLPDCRCSSTNIPGGLTPRNTPQFVTITFDDGVNVENIITYRNVLYNRKNSNGCPAGATFYVSHEYTNYQLVNELYNQGFEIALHSISHQVPQSYWAEATYEDMVKEFGDQKTLMSHFANIPYDAMKGIRLPFLQMTGNASFQMMKEYGLEYDCSWPTIAHVNPGLWPYTLDYASTQDCIVPPCPSASFPGTWVLPMITWRDLDGYPCSMVDACPYLPDRHDEDDWYQFILTNFERHYLGNRAPFGLYIHEAFINVYPAITNAIVKFLNLVNNLDDAFMVNSHEVIEWVKNPKPIDEYKKQECRTFTPRPCNRVSCGPLSAPHNTMEYWMQICAPCPRQYPWLGNPKGE